MQVILVAHGKYALETLNSAEMIVGKQEQIQAISFLETMSISDLIDQYQPVLETDTETLILVDIQGGSPANAAVLLAQEQSNIRIYSGLSLAMVISLVISQNIDTAVQEAQSVMKQIN